MRDSRGSGRTLLLIALLIVTCYFADWTDDYHSYLVSTQYASFESANGRKLPISGGRMDSSAIMAALASRAGAADPQPMSALEAVFGAPLGSSRSATDAGARSLLNRRDLGLSGRSTDREGSTDRGLADRN
jgi:hypothetical protein